MRKLLFFIGCICAVFAALASDKLTANTQAFLSNQATALSNLSNPQPSILNHQPSTITPQPSTAPVFITLTDGNLSQLQALGVIVNARFGNIYTAQIPIGQFEAVAALDNVKRIAIAPEMHEQTDSTRSLSFVDQVQNGTQFGLPKDYDGTGVIYGIIDRGFDFNHAAFQDSLGHTRIKHLYMPKVTTGDSIVIDTLKLPGSQFDSTQIATLTTDFSGYGASHGSHTLGIGAGTRVGNYGGMAPGAELIVCAIGSGSEAPDAVTTANCLRFIQYWAEKMGKPCVISMSLGTAEGPHDGTSDVCQAFDAVAKEGPIICLSAGNNAGRKICLEHEFTTNSTIPGVGSMIANTRSGYASSTSMDTWSQSDDIIGVQYMVINASNDSIIWKSPIVRSYYYTYIGEEFKNRRSYSSVLTQYFTSASKIGTWFYLDDYNGHYHLHHEISLIKKNDSIPDFKVGVQFYAENGVKINSWITTAYSQFTANDSIGEFGFVAGNDSCTINDSSTGHYTISVGSYIGRRARPTISGDIITDGWNGVGNIYSTSSYGVDMNGVAHPFVIAPGYNVISSVNQWSTQTSPTNTTMAWCKPNATTGRTDYWGIMTGTSMATPAVAGIVALWLQANPNLTLDSVRAIIKQTAIRDKFVLKGGIKYGNGKINALGGFTGYQVTYDVNQDGNVNVSDVAYLMSMILNEYHSPLYDINGDGNINISDVTSLTTYLLNQQ